MLMLARVAGNISQAKEKDSSANISLSLITYRISFHTVDVPVMKGTNLKTHKRVNDVLIGLVLN